MFSKRGQGTPVMSIEDLKVGIVALLLGITVIAVSFLAVIAWDKLVH